MVDTILVAEYLWDSLWFGTSHETVYNSFKLTSDSFIIDISSLELRRRAREGERERPTVRRVTGQLGAGNPVTLGQP